MLELAGCPLHGITLAVSAQDSRDNIQDGYR